ncbi:MAG: KxYKxGKxW signal peptide domain-containing protein [Lachnospiraceae bacterium]|nr:KxYKxGKxW signal peptide domain-containing protein [Lachnospiraceae bacterium]MBD5496257.1 KxYKxGKxW signal peptide domain-containing protein [Lachnospiraceae bacterium]MBD5510608.1 KxYKxGKxW signal peptide domain-containing protein [Lachnospiraceae bacterium]
MRLYKSGKNFVFSGCVVHSGFITKKEAV